jgi:hypothetical protein
MDQVWNSPSKMTLISENMETPDLLNHVHAIRTHSNEIENTGRIAMKMAFPLGYSLEDHHESDVGGPIRDIASISSRRGERSIAKSKAFSRHAGSGR